ncbi:MauE/DoxX family redox-associated membrane protein [Flavobacterium quisquiliarum]|uniref:MauE/DoxX family redox-associated membrane protein n=1 Tax=Flavobacterium quisquiliarum TaxID=1834436 RepID=A0ABV8W7Y3_9FLAO|nr:MauE/DoxX family redox-associated membrane protein [Flavobacterium quisquiliarum]MBW1655975.1 hypothetical protein [Flavobacterium quisquiliarum]
MNLSSRAKKYIIETICLLYIFLFVYASASKLLDFQHFRIELGQSPLLSAFANWISILVPAMELIICLLLIIPRFKLIGLFSSYGLMVMFTIYIYIILNYTSFVPCSCGGVLEKLDWKTHMIFNIFFVCLAILGIILFVGEIKINSYRFKIRKIIGLFTVVTLSSILAVVILFMLSENIIHYHNKLTRRFPQTPIEQQVVLDLKLNSFYIAGVDSLNIYLGNSTAPLLITTFTNQFIKKNEKMIDLDRKDLPFRGIRVSVKSPYFFAADGTVPCLFKGNIKDWKAKLMHKGGEYFTTMLAVDSLSVAVVANDSKTGDNVLGINSGAEMDKTFLNSGILHKQSDGVFDTDGFLLYSKDIDRIVYLYTYRNQYTITDRNLKITGNGTTIDTISRAKLNISQDKKHGVRQFSSPPLFVNKGSAVYANILFVNSAIPGRYENDRIWKEASIIDVYDLNDNSYLLSFCIYNLEGRRMKSFTVQNDNLYALIGTHIIRYKIDSKITSKYNKNKRNNLLAK